MRPKGKVSEARRLIIGGSAPGYGAGAKGIFMTTTTGGRHFAKPSLLSLQLALRIFALIALGWVTAYAISLPLAIAMVPGRMDHAV